MRSLFSERGQKYLFIGLAFAVATVAGWQLITYQVESGSRDGLLPPMRVSMTLFLFFIGVVPAWCTALLCFARTSYWFHLALYLWLMFLLAFLGESMGGIGFSLGLLLIPGLPAVLALNIVIFKRHRVVRLNKIYSVIKFLFTLLSLYLVFFCFQVPSMQNVDDSLYSQVVFLTYCILLSFSAVFVLLATTKNLTEYFFVLLLSVCLVFTAWILWDYYQHSILLVVFHVGSLLLFIYPLALSSLVVGYAYPFYKKIKTGDRGKQ